MQDKSIGMLGAARAATAADAHGGDYYGPSGPLQLTGYPVRVGIPAQARDPRARRRLWAESEALTSVRFEL